MRILARMGQQTDLVQQGQCPLLTHFTGLSVVTRRQGDVVENAAMGEQVEVLEHHADAPHAPADLRAVGVVGGADKAFAEQHDLALVDTSRPLMVRISEVLPEPDGPIMEITWPLPTARSMP